MATNNKKYLLLAIILFGFISFLPAQTDNYFFKEEGGELKIFQRFVWSGGEYTLNYEVIFEKETNGEYKLFLREFTKSQFIEVPLPSGSYRFRVIPYDILDRAAEATQWVYFNVFSILQLEEEKEPEPELELEFAYIPEPIAEEESESEPEKLDTLKRVLFSAGAVLGLRSTIYGNNFGNYNFPVNAGVRTSVVFKTPMDIYIGPEVSGNIYLSGMKEKWDMYIFTIGVNLLAMKWFPNEKFAVGLRMGALYPFLSLQGNFNYLFRVDLENAFKDSSLNNLVYEGNFSIKNFIPNTGASFYWLISKRFLLEAGFDFMHIFNDIPSGYFRPMLGINYRF